MQLPALDVLMNGAVRDSRRFLSSSLSAVSTAELPSTSIFDGLDTTAQ